MKPESWLAMLFGRNSGARFGIDLPFDSEKLSVDSELIEVMDEIDDLRLRG